MSQGVAGPLVSIVLPTHNGARFIDEALAAYVAQEYRAWELIAVDDGSTDTTSAHLERWSTHDSRIRWLRHRMNRGLPAALNTGFAEARGVYLTWTSDDNVACPHALQVMIDVLESRPDVDVVYSDYILIDADGTVLSGVRVAEPTELARNNVVGPSFLYRRRVAERVGAYAEDAELAEDYDFWLRAAVQCVLLPLHRPLYRYRVHQESLTGRRPDVTIAMETVLARAVTRLPWLDGASRAKILRDLAHRAARGRRWAAAARHTGAAVRADPGGTLAALERWLIRRMRRQ